MCQSGAAVERHWMEEATGEEQRWFHTEVGRSQIRHQLRHVSRRSVCRAVAPFNSSMKLLHHC